MPDARPPLHILVVEDSEDDAKLVLREIRRGGYEVTHRRVETAEEMREALSQQPWDLVLSDFSLPRFGGQAALAVLQGSGLDLPFIIVSGTIGEETAVEALKAGAHDFLVKHRLARLVPAIERALGDARERRERRAAQQRVEKALEEKVRAEAASQAKSAFLAGMSHEIRTPLNAILGFSELLEDELAAASSPTQAEYVSRIHQAGQHLLDLINGILELTQIESGRLALCPTRVPLATIAAEVRDSLAPLVRKRGLTATAAIADDLPDLQADPVRLRQILYNLLSNAIKFTPAGGSVRLSAQAAGGGVTIEVEDTGFGIREEDMPRLFREFERLPSAHLSGAEGTGLGLALTKKFVELHGGAISVRSEPGRGTTFTVLLPQHPGGDAPGEPGAGARSEPRSAGASGAGVPILIVDDDAPSLELVRAILARDGHEVVAARTVGEALEGLRNRPVALVVTDVQLPGGGGEAVLRAVRGDAALARTAVLAVTARAMPGDRESLLAAGFDGYLGKPIDIRAFAELVRELLRRREVGRG